MAQHGAPTSIMDEKPLTPAARAGLVVNAAITILLFYLTAILFMAGFCGPPPSLLVAGRFAGGGGGVAGAGGRVWGPRRPGCRLRAGVLRACRPPPPVSP